MANEIIGGRYIIQEELGRGASATVFRARDTVLERSVALKVISSGLASDPDFAWRFEQEARLSARLDHPNIVTVHDVGTLADGRAFIAMRLLEGLTLDQWMAQQGQVAPSVVANVIDQLASALDYTHASGLIHRDVKPSNVKIDAAGRATLTDFGIARALNSARMTLPGLTIGTPRYMSPEQVRGEDTSAASDVYSLTVMAYEMMTGRPPFEGDGTALMYKIVHEPPPPPNTFNPWLSASVADVVQKGLAKAPADRWPSAGEFAVALRAALTTSTGRGAAFGADPTVVSASPAATVSTPPAAAGAASIDVTPDPPTLTPGGRPAAESTTAAPVTVPPEPAGEATATSAGEPPGDGGKGGRGRTGVLLGGLAALVAGGGALAGFLLFLPGDDDDGADDDEARLSRVASATASTAANPTAYETSTPTITVGPGTPTATPIPPTQAPYTAIPGGVTQANTATATATSPAIIVASTSTPEPTVTPTVPPPTATTAPLGRNAYITSIVIQNGRYAVFFQSGVYQAANGDHVHFFFNTVQPTQAGQPGTGPWIQYFLEILFTGYALNDKPANATQMCILVANNKHEVTQGSGNCWPLPTPN